MTTLFDQQKVMEIELYNAMRDGREEGRAEGQAEVLRKMLKKASILDVSELTGIPQDEIKRLTQQS